MLMLSPKMGEFLIKVTQTPDLDSALRQLFHEYLELKLQKLEEEVKKFEAKWNVSFNEFIKKGKEGLLSKDIYSYEVEKDFWDWERAETLRKYYKELKEKWI
ncbi:MAG: hypothetical protein K6U04_04115 [Armatimonadetes bacterium]|nr:hypothetical protein [Armatimonadota bacterium]